MKDILVVNSMTESDRYWSGNRRVTADFTSINFKPEYFNFPAQSPRNAMQRAHTVILCDALAQRRSLYVPYRSNYMSLFCVGTELIQVGDGSTVCSWALAPGHKARAIVTVCCVLVFNKKP